MTKSNDTSVKKRRSRGGCISCKQLRIKCNEGKPICEYCSYTRRKCEYPVLKPLKKDVKSRKIPRKPTTYLASPTISSNSVSPSSTTSSQDYEVIENFEVEPPYHYDELTRDLVLTQSTSMLGISKFELRLLQFFDQECIHMFSYGINEDIKNAWKYKVPYLFLESDLVRKSIFSLSAMTLSSSIDLNWMQAIDAIDDEKSLTGMYNVNPNDPNSMFMETAKYFMKVIEATRSIIDPTEQKLNFEDPLVAKELAVSSILTFTYLGIHPQRIVPLIDFSKESSDLIQIARGIRTTMLNVLPIIMKSDIAGILLFRNRQTMENPSYKICSYPIIVELKKGVENLETDEVSSFQSEKMTILKETIQTLMQEMCACKFFKIPLPLFRFLMLLSDDFRDLLYAKDPFALRVLFVYVTLCSIANFKFYHDKN
ncbi:Transcription factor with zinc finger DNA-binding motif, putative, partial [Candida maltosa Xu316]